MPEGYTVNTTSLAARVGELRAVAGAVTAAASALDSAGGDLGPGELNAAVTEVAQEWRDGLAEMTAKIDEIAGNVADAVDGYESYEATSTESFRQVFGTVVAP
ncbi:hypothetical protein [Amycolatopsis magusensis]|uniref:hypothetical protein n=1 Tax=Amycolatopsis magusensis TaxID=882444 RepID=UPI003C2AD8AF